VIILLTACSPDRPYVRIFTPLEQQSYRSGDPIEVFGVFSGDPEGKAQSSLTLSHDGIEVPSSEIWFEVCSSDPDADCGQSFSVTLTAGETDGWIRATFRGTLGREDVDVVSFRADGAGSGTP
jgi:hypothetical protein